MATSVAPTRSRSASGGPFAPGQLAHRPAAPAPRNALALVGHSRTVLAEAARADSPGERFRLSHLSALRSAAAVLADRARPTSGPRRLRSAWDLLITAAPELADWSIYFAAGAAKREAIEAGAANVVTARDADDLLRASYEFLRAVESSLGLLIEPVAS